MRDKDIQDNMGYREAAKKLGVKKDHKLKLATVGLYWVAGTIFAGIIMHVVDPDIDVWKKAAACLIEGLVLAFVLIFSIGRSFDGETAYMREIYKRMNAEGMSHQLAAELDAHMRMFQKNTTNAGYYNAYLLLLVGYNDSISNYNEAMRLLDIMDINDLNTMYKFTTGKRNMVTYQVYRVIVASRIDVSLMERNYGDASKVFSECRGIDGMIDLSIDEANAVRYIALRKLDEAEALIRNILTADIDAAKLDGNDLLGRCAFLRGDIEGGNRYMDEALKYARTQLQRECIERERQKGAAYAVDKGV